MAKRKRGELPTPAEATIEMGLKDGWVCIGIEHRIGKSKTHGGTKKYTYVQLFNPITNEKTNWMQKQGATKKYGTQNKDRLSVPRKHTTESLEQQIAALSDGNAVLLERTSGTDTAHPKVKIQYNCGCIVEKPISKINITPDCPIHSAKWRTENEVCTLIEETAPKLADKDVRIETNRQKTVHMHYYGEPITRRFDMVIEITHREDESIKRWVVVEYNGEQHYFPVNFGNLSEEELMEAFRGNQLRDAQKAAFCKRWNIPLIIISYKEKGNIEEIVKTKVRDAIWEQSFDVAFMHFQKNNT